MAPEQPHSTLSGTDADGTLLAMLTVFNDCDDLDGALQQALDLATSVLGGRIGEVWLAPDATRSVHLAYRSTDGSPGADAFHAACRESVPTGPALVRRVRNSGRASSASIGSQGGGDAWRSAAAALGIRTALAFPILATGGVIGVLVVYSEAPRRPARAVLDIMPMACHHIGRYLERARADGAIQKEAVELSALASTDALTGLNNRREFDRALRTIPREPFAILSVDVDHLKTTNDTHGHAAGDALLRLVGDTLGRIVRGWDVIARVGGDEFAALLPGVGVFGAGQVAERMRAAMHALTLPTGPVRITAGWSAAPAGADPVSVWQRADECLYKAKHAGRDTVVGCSYQRGEYGDIADRSYSDVVTRLLDGGLLTTMFQPIINLTDGSVMGYEALARPEGFAAMDTVEAVFEAARNTGQIRHVDWVCRCRAIEDAMLLPHGIDIFVNISAAALLDPIHGVDQMLLLLRTAGRAPQTVVLEITEHERIRDYDALGRVLASYRAEGIRFALDDVGEGHSTLELLAASASEYLKLGRSLTMTSNRVGSRAAIEATMAFARATGAVVIAEGVENEFVADLMKAAGIRFGQGFGLGKPTLAADVEDVAAALQGRAALTGLRPRRAAVRS